MGGGGWWEGGGGWQRLRQAAPPRRAHLQVVQLVPLLGEVDLAQLGRSAPEAQALVHVQDGDVGKVGDARHSLQHPEALDGPGGGWVGGWAAGGQGGRRRGPGGAAGVAAPSRGRHGSSPRMCTGGRRQAPGGHGHSHSHSHTPASPRTHTAPAHLLAYTTSSTQQSAKKGARMNQGAVTLPHSASRACSMASTALLLSFSERSRPRSCGARGQAAPPSVSPRLARAAPAPAA